MSDVTSTTVLTRVVTLAGVNIAYLTNPSVSAADTIELEDVLIGGANVKRVLGGLIIEDPAGTAVNIPLKHTTTNDTITIGTGPSSAAVEIIVHFF